MQRPDLIGHVQAIMARAGFMVSERCDLRPVSFDLICRRDKDLVLLKVLTNVDALGEDIANEIKLLCKFLDARPLMVGIRAGTGALEDGVVYARHGIPIITPNTLHDYALEGDAPMVFAAPGGFYVNLDVEMLRAVRIRLGLSLGVMAQIAGVSRRAIQMYEEGMSASIDAAMRLEDQLGVDLIRPLDPFRNYTATEYQASADKQAEDPTEALVRNLLESLGYQFNATKRSPFNAISTQANDSLLTGMGQDSPQLRRRAAIVASISQITGRPGFFVVERTNRTQLEGTPVMNRTEFLKLSDPEAILNLILERQIRMARD